MAPIVEFYGMFNASPLELLVSFVSLLRITVSVSWTGMNILNFLATDKFVDLKNELTW